MKVEQDTRDKKTNAWRWKMMFGVDFCRCVGCFAYQNYS